MKVVSILLILVGLGAMGAGIASAPSHASAPAKLPMVAMREIGAVPAGSVVAEKSAPAVPAPKAEPAAERGNGKALEKALEKTAEKPNDDLAVPAEKPAPEKSRPPPPAEKPAPEKTAEKAPPPAERAAPPPSPARNTGGAKAPPAEKTAASNPSDDAPPPAAPAAATTGVLNLRASDTADVFVDGKKVGSSPLLGLKVKAGKHKVRFDCYLPSGETKAGPTQSHDVAADGEKDVEYECPSE